MTILDIIILIISIILFSVWIGGACNTCSYVDDHYSFISNHFVFDTLVMLAIAFFWPIFRLYFLIRNWHKKHFPDYYGNKLRRKLKRKRGDLV